MAATEERQGLGGASNDTNEGYERNTSSQSPFLVGGIALVVDQRGKGAKMVMRYPPVPLTSNTEDLFYRLPSRQMAKLFRPKPALCGQPMTLSIGGTVFCCCAVLMDEKDGPVSTNKGEGAGNNNESDDDVAADQLQLFSVIVALAPQIRLSSIPVSGWLEGQSQDYHSIQPNLYQTDESTTKTGGTAATSSSTRARRVSASFLSIRRVHVSLARVCRLLEREERRCQYVSAQTLRYQQIRNDLKQKWRLAHHQSDATGNTGSNTATSATNSPVSISSSKTTQTGAGGGGARHKRNNSFSFFERENNTTTSASTKQTSVLDANFLESNESFQQEFLDTIMSLGSSEKDDDNVRGEPQSHPGNLARELIQVYHALSRNDHDFPPTPGALLSGRDGIVFINRHLATAIEAVSPPRHLVSSTSRNEDSNKPTVRPYQALVFPHASPSELLESLTSSSAGPPRRLVQLLRTVQPHKSLAEVAREANVPLQVTLDMASSLVEEGACVVAPVLSRNSRLACRRMDLIPMVSLAFAQTFGDALPVFHLVAYLTGGRTLGEAMVAWKTSPNDHWLLEKLKACHPDFLHANMGNEHDDDDDNDARLNALEDVLYQMCVWLYSHRVLVQTEEYLVGTAASSATDQFTINENEDEVSDQTERKTDTNARLDRLSDHNLYKELLDSGCLEGNKSLRACSWQTGIDAARLRTFAIQYPNIRLVVRVPDEADD